MILNAVILAVTFSLSHGGVNSIRTVGQSSCSKSGVEERITMRVFGDKTVPCDVIVKTSTDGFKKLKLIIDSKKQDSVCRDQFEAYQKSLKDKGYTCTVSVAPAGESKKQPAVIIQKPEHKPEPEQKPDPTPESKAIVTKPQELAPQSPVANPEAPVPPPSLTPTNAVPVAPQTPKAKKAVPTNVQTPPPPPSDWVPPKKK